MKNTDYVAQLKAKQKSLAKKAKRAARKEKKSASSREVGVRAFVRGSKVDPASDDFLSSFEWRAVRMMVLRRDGARCACCGATPADGLRVHVDHIKPRKLYPKLALDQSNLQVLCEECNHGKGNWDETDWRGNNVVVLEEWQAEHLASLAKA